MYREYSKKEIAELQKDIKNGLRKKFPNGIWKNKNNCIKKGKICVEEIFGDNPTDSQLYSMTVKNFTEIKQRSFLTVAFKDSPSTLATTLYPHLSPYKFKIVPSKTWQCISNVKKATKLCLKEMVGDSPTDSAIYSITKKSLEENGWSGLLQHGYGSCVQDLIMSEYPDLCLYKFKKVPKNTWKNPHHVTNATKMCIEDIVGKNPTDEMLYAISESDIRIKKWTGLLSQGHGGKVINLVTHLYKHLDRNMFIRFKMERKIKILSEKLLNQPCSSFGDQNHEDFKKAHFKPDVYFKELNLLIEYHGKQHFCLVERYHRNGIKDLHKQQNRDKKLREYCKTKNIYLIEISYLDHKKIHIDDVLTEKINKWIIDTKQPPFSKL